jgi:hypothetical protein
MCVHHSSYVVGANDLYPPLMSHAHDDTLHSCIDADGGSNTAWDYNAGLVPAILGGQYNAAQAYQATMGRVTTTFDGSRFPGYALAGCCADGAPQMENTGIVRQTIQKMLVTADNPRRQGNNSIYLLPSWPKDRDVAFSLQVPLQTTVTVEFKDGKITSLVVLPDSRRQDVVMPSFLRTNELLKTDDEATVPLFSTWEARLQPPAGFTNPCRKVYNISELNATATVTTPGQHRKAVHLRGFFMISMNSTASIVFRFTPSTAGQYVVAMFINGVAQELRSFTATGQASPHSGFVRVGPNKQHFVLSGQNRTYFGIGENLAWQDGPASSDTDDHLWAPYLKNLSSSGANYIRVWLTDSWTDLYVENSLGNYSQENSHKVDKLLQMAETMGIRVLMCTESFNLFCSKPKPTPCSWDKSVYNEANGGMLSNAGDFFTDPRAIALYKQRLQYLVSRFSHSTAVFAWEFFNEVDITDGYTASSMAIWTQDMSRHLRSIDPFSHPISTSFCCNDPKQVWELPEMDFVMTHSYSTHNKSDMADNSQFWNVLNSKQFDKPTYVAETGEATRDNHHWPADPTGIGLHNALWASMASLGAMTSMVWYWDSWVACSTAAQGARGDDSGDCLYSHFTAVARFASRIEYAAFRWEAIGHSAPPKQCTDKNPDPSIPPKFTCQQQASYGKCGGGPNGSNPWMLGMCCKTCYPNSTSACVKCSSHGAQQPGHKAVPLGSGARLFGMIGRPLLSASMPAADSTPLLVLWVQNINNTFTLQNATRGPTERPRLDLITGLEIDVSQFVAMRASFEVAFTNTTTGEETQAPKKLICPSLCTVEVPGFTTDVAITLRPSHQ